MEKSPDTRQVTKFKNELAKSLKDLSVCFSTDVREMPKEQLVTMVEMIVRIITANHMTFDFEPYANAIRKIACGKAEIYRFNIVGLMKVFSEECDQYVKNLESKKCQR